MFGLGLGLGIHRHSNTNPYAFPFISRVESDGGAIRDKAALLNLTYYLQSMMPNTKLLYCPELGVKLRTSGVNNYVTKLYDLGPGMIDGDQTTALNQPYLSGNIAPNEKRKLKYLLGETVSKTVNMSSTVTMQLTDDWVLTFVIKPNVKKSFSLIYLHTYSNIELSKSYLRINSDVNNSSIAEFSANYIIPGIYNIVQVVYNSGSVFAIVNGERVLISSSIPNNLTLSKISVIPTYSFDGELPFISLVNKRISEDENKSIYNYLRAVYPDIEGVDIGNQHWATSNCEMTCTPQGNVIPEMQAATNVEMITNAADRDFSSDTGFWSKTAGITILNSICNIKSVAGEYVALARSNILVIGKYYKLTYAIINNRGGQLETDATVPSINLDSTVGNHTYYIKATDTTFRIKRTSICDIDIDNVSIQEVGWSDSTNLYNDVYANTTGTAEQKEYAAVKAAAMWCYYNNDPTLGAVYGKLYNWYAVKLLQMDIDYYNAANPTTPWGWRVPISTDFTTLSTYLGGNAVSGGKMKKEGLGYWSAPNLADNTSGLSLIGSGFRQISTGTFLYILSKSFQYTLDKPYLSTYGYVVDSGSYTFGWAAGTQSSIESCGMSLRLIKA